MSLSRKITKTKEGMRVWQQERSIFEVTELICEIMDREGITKAKLASRLGKSKSFVTQLLSGQSNMTVRTLSDVFLALGRSFNVYDGPVDINEMPRHSFSFQPEWRLLPARMSTSTLIQTRSPQASLVGG